MVINMTLREKEGYIIEIKKCIEKLLASSENKEAELQKVIRQPKLKDFIVRDEELLILTKMCDIEIVENALGCKEKIFDNVFSLADAQSIYTNLKYFCRRFEYNMPEEILLEGIEYMVNNQITGAALFYVMQNETEQKEQNIVVLSQYLQACGQVYTATVLLQRALCQYEQNAELLVQLADCWMEARQWEQAYRTLKKIVAPSYEIEEIIANLEEVMGYENI